MFNHVAFFSVLTFLVTLEVLDACSVRLVDYICNILDICFLINCTYIKNEVCPFMCVSLCGCKYVSLSVCLHYSFSNGLSVCMSVLSICLFLVCLSCIYQSTCLCLCLYLSSGFHAYLILFACLPICPLYKLITFCTTIQVMFSSNSILFSALISYLTIPYYSVAASKQLCLKIYRSELVISRLFLLWIIN